MEALVPWLFGFVGFGIGVLIVGGNSPWLYAFAFAPVAVTMILMLL